MKQYLLLGIALFFFVGLQAQQFGGNPPSLKWKQIDTDTVRVIFPVGLDSQAIRVANTVHYLNRHHDRSIGTKYRKIDIVLQNQTLLSNGYVGLAPYRSEFYMTPPQDITFVGGNWTDLLSIHEYRHVQQFNNARVGLTKLSYWLAGELGWSTLSRLSIPDWFWEGDAVVYETALTNQGRGRMPAFFNGFRDLSRHNRLYNYQKMRNGSLRDFVPNEYPLGYLLSQYGREQYGNDFWKDIMKSAAAYRGLFFSFSRNLKAKTGYGVGQFYDRAMAHYAREWETKRSGMDTTDAHKAVDRPEKQVFTNYRHPYIDPDGNLYYFKSSYRQPGAFYHQSPGGRTRRLQFQGISLDSYFSFSDGKLVWSEMGFDPRWGWKNYANVHLHNLGTGKARKLVSRSKIMSPDIAENSNLIAAVRIDVQQSTNVIILEAASGELVKVLPNEEGHYLAYPRWTNTEDALIAVARDVEGRSALVRIDVTDGSMRALTAYTNHQIGVPWVTDEHVYFSASFSGIDNIHAIKLKHPGIFQVTSTTGGAYDVSTDPADRWLVYSEFSYMGYDIKKIAVKPDTWRRVYPREPAEMDLYRAVSHEREGGNIVDKIPSHTMEITRYPMLKKLINVHSWGFYFDDPNFDFSLRSENVLNTLDLEAGVRYNRNEENFTYFLNGSYAQYFPVFNISAWLSSRTGRFTSLGQDGNGNVDTLDISGKWLESTARPGISIPLNLTSGMFSRFLTVFANYDHRLVSNKRYEILNSEEYRIPDEWLVNDVRHSQEYGFLFRNIRQRARMNIFPKYSQYLLVKYLGAVDQFDAKQLFVDSEFTFPGAFLNHSSNIQLSYQDESASDNYRYGDNFFYPRGYTRPYYQVTQSNYLLYDQMLKIGANYHFPIAYPDVGIPGLIYFYRARGNAFFDHGRAWFSREGRPQIEDIYNSVGGELIVDTKLLNTYEMSFGVRYSYLLNQNPLTPGRDYLWEFFLPLQRF